MGKEPPLLAVFQASQNLLLLLFHSAGWNPNCRNQAAAWAFPMPAPRRFSDLEPVFCAPAADGMNREWSISACSRQGKPSKWRCQTPQVKLLQCEAQTGNLYGKGNLTSMLYKSWRKTYPRESWSHVYRGSFHSSLSKLLLINKEEH